MVFGRSPFSPLKWEQLGKITTPWLSKTPTFYFKILSYYQNEDVYYTLHPENCTLDSAQCTLQTSDCTLHNAHYMLHTACCMLHPEHNTLHTARRIIFNLTSDGMNHPFIAFLEVWWVAWWIISTRESIAQAYLNNFWTPAPLNKQNKHRLPFNYQINSVHCAESIVQCSVCSV